MKSGGDWAAHWNDKVDGRNYGEFTTVVGSTAGSTLPVVTQQNCLSAAVSAFGSKVTSNRSWLVTGRCVVRDPDFTLSPARVWSRLSRENTDGRAARTVGGMSPTAARCSHLMAIGLRTGTTMSTA